MKRLLIGFVLLVVIVGAAVVGVGFYRGWFQVSAAGTNGNPTITVDQDKIKADKEKAAGAVQDAGQKVKDKTNAATGKDKEEAPKP